CGATGEGVSLAGANPFTTDAGGASIVAQVEPQTAAGALYALAILRDGGRARVLAASASIEGLPLPYEVRYTTHGSEPGASSPVYSTPVAGSPLRAAVVVAGRVVAALDERAEKFRVRGSTPPESRDPFRHGRRNSARPRKTMVVDTGTLHDYHDRESARHTAVPCPSHSHQPVRSPRSKLASPVPFGARTDLSGLLTNS